jgi:hypothetical protein
MKRGKTLREVLMAEQTTYVLDTRVASTGEVIPIYSIRIDLGTPQAAPAIQPLTLVNLGETASRVVWRELRVASSEVSSEDTELERLRDMARRGEIALGPGGIPEGFWDMLAPEDPEGLVRRALIEDRNGS